MRKLDIQTPDHYYRIVKSKSWEHLRDTSMLLLPQLPNLHHLFLAGGREFMSPERHLHAFKLMPNLRHLDLQLTSDGSWSESTLEPLKHLSAATTLSLRIRDMSGPMLVSPFLAQLTQLQALFLHCEGVDREINQAHLMQTVSKLTGLASLGLDGMVESVPAELEKLANLTYLELSSINTEDVPFTIPSSFGLCLSLRHINLGFLEDPSDKMWQQVCSALLLLPQLHALDISNANLSEIQPSSWALPSRLTSLYLDECRLSRLPSAVCSLPQLEHLSVVDLDWHVQMANLPRGPYICNLVSLDINEPLAGVGPEALTDAVHLQTLMVRFTQSPGPLWAKSALQGLVPTGCEIDLDEEEQEHYYWSRMHS